MFEIRFIYFDIQPSFSSIPPQMRSFSPIYTYNIYYIIIAFIFDKVQRRILIQSHPFFPLSPFVEQK